MKAKELVEKYRNNQCTEEERIQLRNWFHQLNLEKDVTLTEDCLQTAEQNIWKGVVHTTRPNKLKLWHATVVAATLCLAIGVGYYAYYNNPHSKTIKTAAQDILPGGNNAVLILANGKRISLTEAGNGDIAEQAGISIRKTAEGKLVYAVKEETDPDNNLSNTIETPAGGQYQVILPDGTSVYLNTSSSITFPTSFTSKKERKITLIGEAYFEVTKNKEKPFKVLTPLQEITVLGTHFNVNAYADDDLTLTTLLEGKIKVASANGTPKHLVPGQQSAVNNTQFDVQTVDVESAVAWQNGEFRFENESVPAVMRKIARWYNIEVSYQGNFDNIKLLGSVSRNKKLSEVLRVIQLSRKVKFKVSGRRITVMQ